jgi:competence protein ComEA
MMRSLFFVLLVSFSVSSLAGELVDINAANAAQLASALDGIGQKKAEKIVAWRTDHGAFKSLDDVAKVTGIGQKLTDRNKNWIQFGSKAAISKTGKTSSQSSEKSALTLPIGAYSSR